MDILEGIGFDDYYEDPGDCDWDEDEEDFDCGFVRGLGCQLAGTEDCDFECPYRALLVASPSYPNCDIVGGVPIGL